ncbi:MAG: hypothetical protein NZ853_05105 [Leptospiraceae bacterium]|nr:hypothetical protein [Leptospiraceae bacterium]MDW7976675.1 hypothetical protein [Leptospiraceae bacterium]
MKNKKLTSLFFLFLFGCANLQETEIPREVSRFISIQDEQKIQKRVINLDQKESIKKSFPSKFIIGIKSMKYSENIDPQSREAINTFLDYIFRAIEKQYPNIVFQTTEQDATHHLRIFVKEKNQEQDNDNFFFEIRFLIQNEKKRYDFSGLMVKIQKEVSKNHVLVDPKRSKILFPISFRMFTSDEQNVQEFLNKFKDFGLGKISIYSSYKNEAWIYQQEHLIYRGITPIELELPQGEYELMYYEHKNIPQKIPFIVEEDQHHRILLRTDDMLASNVLNLSSNDTRFQIFVNGESYGSSVYLSEIPVGNYVLRFTLEDKNKVYDLEREIYLSRNSRYYLFYPKDYYVEFRPNAFREEDSFLWFEESNQKQEKIKSVISKHGLLIAPQKKIFSSHFICDDLALEMILDGEEFQIILYFEKFQVLVHKSHNYLLVYDGNELLNLKHIYNYQITYPKEGFYLYFDYDTKSQELSIFVNTKTLYEKKILSKYVMVGLENQSNSELVIKKLSISNQKSMNLLSRWFYFTSKRWDFNQKRQWDIQPKP